MLINSWFPFKKINFSNIKSKKFDRLWEFTKPANENRRSVGVEKQKGLVLNLIKNVFIIKQLYRKNNVLFGSLIQVYLEIVFSQFRDEKAKRKQPSEL